MAAQSIDGTWRGHYSYLKNPDEGSGFDAIFIDKGGTLEGRILDDVVLGEAIISGTFSFPSVSFTKVYLNPGLDPIKYEGRMNDDGNSMSGTWVIYSGYGTSKGTWAAHRKDDAEKKEAKERQSKVKEREIDEVAI